MTVLGLLLVGSVGVWLADSQRTNFDSQLRAADAAYSRGDYAAALRLIRPLADKGNANAQHNLGALYVEGRGVPQNDAEAMKWYRLAAE